MRLAADLGTFPALCLRGHRMIPSTGVCWTMREIEPGLYDYEFFAEPCPRREDGKLQETPA